MAKEYIERNALIAEYDRVHIGPPGGARKLMEDAPTVDVVEVRHGKWESFEIPHMVRCSECGVSDLDIHRTKFVFCPYCGARMDGTPKERGAEKPKVACLNCKHFMFSDMYGECNKQLRIVNPSDTCEYAEPKERGGEK